MDTWTSNFWAENETECKRILMEPGNWEKVPLFDHKTALGTLVRFKGMVQDMLNPEYYSKTFSVFNSVTNETKIYQGKYHSFIVNKSEENIQLGDDLMERQVVVCVPIPGLNKWVDDVTISNNEIEVELQENFNKRIRLDPACQNPPKDVLIFVYPESVESCELKLNEIVEVVGFLNRRTIEEDNEDIESLPAKETYCIHTVHYKLFPNLTLNNIKTMDDCIWEEASSLHTELKLILTQALLGDSLVADYLLFHLVSTIYNRQRNHVPGKFSLNIRGIPNNIEKNYTTKLYSLISYLVVKSEYLSITIDSMNNTDMIPRKCYTSNRLLNGLLQLSNRTHLVLDETNLEPGKLDNKGMTNLQALTDVITNQQMKYDFTYYTIDYETQIPVLTLSIGKSLLPCDIDIVLNPDPSCTNNIEETIDSAYNYLNSQLLLLEKLRKYIAIISTFPFNFSEDVLQIIENDYVEMRKADVKNMSADDLHRFIMISKLIALCAGKNELNKDIWESCKTLESQRKLRNKSN
ncbi:Mini-chromosome maintenance complex-binding protein [Cinara cedri]|uniref:Mini-chromosome maintenance complex-binding protein n=1 Tax=Cinara cedri TaxID=506608 RepID=A0A5E4MJ38_9HEMI|nr:Mini-chromosome maintenance complex-binding protein [Cinara cedri]